MALNPLAPQSRWIPRVNVMKIQVILTILFAAMTLLPHSSIAGITYTGKIYNTHENQPFMTGHLEFIQDDTVLSADYGSEVLPGPGDEISENEDFSRSRRRGELHRLDRQGAHNGPFKKGIEIMRMPNKRNLGSPYENNTFFQYLTLEGKRSLRVPGGQTLTFFVSSRGELYQNQGSKYHPPQTLNDFSPEGRKATVSLDPQAGVEWTGPSLPLRDSANIVFQPSGKLIISPRKPIGTPDPMMGGMGYMGRVGPNDIHHGNERGYDIQGDNRSFNSEAFSSDEMKERGHYTLGGELLASLGSLGDWNVKIEQKYFFTSQQNALGNQVPAHSFSDPIGHIETTFSVGVILNGQIKLNQRSLKPTLSNVGISIGPERASLSINYALIDDYFTPGVVSQDFPTDEGMDITPQKPTKQISFNFNSQITPNWSFESSFMKDVQKSHRKEPGSYQYASGFHYHRDHFRGGLTVNHQFFSSRGSKPETRFIVSFGFNY